MGSEISLYPVGRGPVPRHANCLNHALQESKILSLDSLSPTRDEMLRSCVKLMKNA